MAFKTNSVGIAFKCNDALLSCGATWAMKLSQLSKQEGTVRIITYSLPNMEYVETQFSRRPYDIFLIAHEKFATIAGRIKNRFQNIRIALNKSVHSKILMIEPSTIYISSANFGLSKWHETSLGFHSKKAHQWYLERAFLPLWEKSTEV
jgi:hypothetical protein